MTTPRKYTAVYNVLRNDNVLSLMASVGKLKRRHKHSFEGL